MEIELLASQRKPRQMQHELNIINKKLVNFSQDFEFQLDSTLEAKEHDFLCLKADLNEHKKAMTDLKKQMALKESENIAKDSTIFKLQDRLLSSVSLIRKIRDNLRRSQEVVDNLNTMARQEQTLKESHIQLVNTSLEGGTNSAINQKISSEVEIAVCEAFRSSQAIDIENANLKHKIDELKSEARFFQDNLGTKQDLSAVKPRSDDKKPRFFTQGSLLLDIQDMF